MAGTDRSAREEQAGEATALLNIKQTEKEGTWQEWRLKQNGLWRIRAHWYWKWVVEPKHSFQKEAGQDLSNLRERGNSASVQDWHLNPALLFPSADSEIIIKVYLFFLFHLRATTMLHDEEVQAQVTRAANGFWVLLVFNRPGVFLGVTKYCSARVVLESGSHWEQKLPKCSTASAEFSVSTEHWSSRVWMGFASVGCPKDTVSTVSALEKQNW